MHDLSKYTAPTSFWGIAVPTKVVGMLVVSALPTKVVGMQAYNQIQESEGTTKKLTSRKPRQKSSHGTEDLD